MEHEHAVRNAQLLRSLHESPRLLVLPNAWDAVSAKTFESTGFPALATTSAGVAAAVGHGDHQEAPVDEMLAAAKRIIAAVEVPVTIDFEAGYNLPTAEVVDQLIAIGAAGFNFEDTNYGGGDAKLVDAETQATRIAALKEAGRARGVDLVLNARVDVFIQRLGTPEEQLSEGLRRAKLYRDAGADCIYPILLNDEAMIRQFVDAVGVVNINVRRDGPISLQRASELGVRRVSYATSLFRETRTFIEGLATAVRDEAATLPGSSG